MYYVVVFTLQAPANHERACFDRYHIPKGTLPSRVPSFITIPRILIYPKSVLRLIPDAATVCLRKGMVAPCGNLTNDRITGAFYLSQQRPYQYQSVKSTDLLLLFYTAGQSSPSAHDSSLYTVTTPLLSEDALITIDTLFRYEGKSYKVPLGLYKNYETMSLRKSLS